MRKLTILLFFCSQLMAAKAQDSLAVRATRIGGNLYLLDCTGGFGGGNVAASIGDEGILLVDDMFAKISPKLVSSLQSISDKPIRMILNTHFHGDHIQGNLNFKKSAIIIAHENVNRRLLKNNKESNPTLGMLASVTFSDSLSLYFNGEEIKMIHFPNSHTDGDAIVYFTGSKVLHLGDMFFFEMFPAVYSEGGGDIRQLIAALEQIVSTIPADAHVIPGHGRLATMHDLTDYLAMLKETVRIVDGKIRSGATLDQMKKDKVLSKYDALGEGGAQTTDQYLSMLYKLLTGKKGNAAAGS